MIDMLTGRAAPLARAESSAPRDDARTRATDAASDSSFSALLDRALAPHSAARPLTRPAAAEGAEARDDAAAEAEEIEETAEPRAGETADAAATPAGEEAATPVDDAAPAVHRDTDALTPELRERLERVVERMRSEFGYDVRVTETYRSQARQDQLHAQGRTTDGPVVTWTRSSQHTLGRAADVMVNGGYDDPQAYATLQRVAREEGLHTLGVRDPGHLELPRDVAAGGSIAGRRIDLASLAELARPAGVAVRVSEVHVGHDAPAAAAPVATLARVAAVAHVAPLPSVAAVASVANVARVATVAAPGAAAPAARGARAAASPAAAATPGGGGSAGSAAASDESVGASGRRRTGRDARQGETAGEGARHDGPATSAFGQGAGETAQHEPAVARTQAAGGANPAESIARMDRIEALRDGAAARPLSHVTLMVENATGGEDRIRVGLRGAAVGATLELSDPRAVDRMSASLGELQQALEQRGLETEALRVRRQAAVVPESIEMHRVVGLAQEREAARTGNAPTGQQSTAQRERDGRSPSDERRQDSSSPHHRSRRDPKEGR